MCWKRILKSQRVKIRRRLPFETCSGAGRMYSTENAEESQRALKKTLYPLCARSVSSVLISALSITQSALHRAQPPHFSIMLRRLFSFTLLLCFAVYAPAAQSQTAPLSPADDAFLEDLSHRAFLYFQEHADPHTGLVLDRARATGAAHPPNHPSFQIASSAATGFGLTALCIGAERGWITRDEARTRIRTTLQFLLSRAPHEHGWFPHWMDAATGARRWRSEYSSIDTALLLGGVLTARAYFREDQEIVRLATAIYELIDFPWMLAGHTALLSHGWKPESGFLKAIWDTYSEHLILQLLGIGSPTNALPPRVWRAWQRTSISYLNYTYLDGDPLFIHQYSHSTLR